MNPKPCAIPSRIGDGCGLEAHLTYERELGVGDPIEVTTQVLGHDQKRLHLFHTMYHAAEGFRAATNELLALHVDLPARRATPFPKGMSGRIAALAEAHAPLGRPAQAGRVIGLGARPPGD